MAGSKIKVTFEINPDSYEMRKSVFESTNLPDTPHLVSVKCDIATYHGDSFFRRLGSEQPIEWIPMVER